MQGVGDGGGDYHQLDGSQRLLLNIMTTQMQQLLNRNNEELYRRIEGLEHQMNPNAGRPYGGNKRLKVKLAVATFSDYALVWWKKNQREMKREEGREIDTWTEMRRVMQKRYVPTIYSRTMWQKLQRLSQGSLTVEEHYKKMEMALVRANIEEDTKVVRDGFTNKISFQHHDQKIILKPLSLREVCDDQIRMGEKKEQEKENSEAPQRNSKKKEFKDVFPKEIPHGLPPSRSIEHQVDLLLEASLPNRPAYKNKSQETQHKDAQAKVEYVKRLYDHVKVQIAKKNKSYARQANKNRKEVVLEPGDDPEHLRANVFQEGGNDENPKTIQIQGPMTRSRTKQSVDTLQQTVTGILSKTQVEKDEGPSRERRRPKWRRTKGLSGEGRRPRGRGTTKNINFC
ncbi:hypothetical protein HKD37_17G047618 [Glycine soja]